MPLLWVAAVLCNWHSGRWSFLVDAKSCTEKPFVLGCGKVDIAVGINVAVVGRRDAAGGVVANGIAEVHVVVGCTQ